MNRTFFRLCSALCLVGSLFGCQKEDIPGAVLFGTWGVSSVEVILNEEIIPISKQTVENNYKNAKHTFNADNSYSFTDIDGSSSNGTWKFLPESKEILINYPSLEYDERFEILTKSENELVLKTPTVIVTRASTDQDLETIFTASFLLISTPSRFIEPNTVSIVYKLKK